MNPEGYNNDQPVQYNSGMNVIGVTNYFLIEFKSPQERTHAWYCRPSQEPMAGEVIGPRREHTIILLNEQYQAAFHIFIFISKE